MTPEQHRRAGEIFDQLNALTDTADLDSGLIEATLAAACPNEPELAAHVRRLLVADRRANQQEFLAQPAIEDAAQLLSVRLPAPDRILGGNYQLLRRIGSGGMGTVYEAQDLRLQRRVAVKVLPNFPNMEGEERSQRFEQEARSASLLNHPNIIGIYDANVDAEGFQYIVMELVDGKTLRNVPASSLDLIDVISQVAAALAAAHAAGIIHRDIKPENIMVRSDGLVKVLDFGLAKWLRPDSDPTLAAKPLLTRPGQLAGTIQYFSPEQVAGKPVDARTDIFSLGVIAYELACGHRPFDGPTDGAIFSAILNQQPAPTGKDPALEAIILRALEKDPELRFQTAADFRSALRRLLRASSSSSGLLPAPPPPQPKAPVQWLPWIVATLACCLAALVWWFGRSSTSTQPLLAHFEQLTRAQGEEIQPSLSPNGDQFLYASRASGNWDIYLQRSGGNNPINLTKSSNADDFQPAYSPDGARIAFRSERDGGGLYVMDSTGENPRRVASAGYFPAWAPDNRRIAFCDETFEDANRRGFSNSRITILDLESGQSRRIEQTGDAVQPQWSPDGRLLAYWGLNGGGQRIVYTVALDGKQPPRAITDDESFNVSPVWAPNGDALFFLSSRGGPVNVWRIAVDPATGTPRGKPAPVTLPAANVSAFQLAANGKSLIYTLAAKRMELSMAPFDPVHIAVTGPAQPVGQGSYVVANFRLSQDGSRIVYDTITDTSEDIWIMNADGSERRRLTTDAYRDRSPAISPDAKEVLFFSDRTGVYQTWSIRTDGSGLRQQTKMNFTGIQDSLWTPDGKRALTNVNRRPPTWFDPFSSKPNQQYKAFPGFTEGVSHYLLDWYTGELAIGDRRPSPGKPDIFLYNVETGQIEYPGIQGLSPIWSRLPGEPNRYFLFLRDQQCLIYDRKTKRESVLFTASHRLYNLGLDPSHGRFFFSQIIQDADLWLARIESSQK